jgi:hypothetical protein
MVDDIETGKEKVYPLDEDFFDRMKELVMVLLKWTLTKSWRKSEVGLYDEIRSSYDLGEQFTNVEMQTKGLACAMTRYWISPDGYLYELTYRETHDFAEIGEDDESIRS